MRIRMMLAVLMLAAFVSTGIVFGQAPNDGFPYHMKGYVLYSYVTESHGKDLPVDQRLANDFVWYGFGTRDQLLAIARSGNFNSWPAKSVATDPANGYTTIKTVSMGVPEVVRNTEEGRLGAAIPTQFVDSFVIMPGKPLKHHGAVKYYKEDGTDQPKFISAVPPI